MGDSSVYASHGATTRAYGGYKLFSATIGTMLGLQLPKGITSIMDDIDGLTNSLEKNGDIKLGVSPDIFNVHVGLNMGIFKIDNLYLGLRVGYFNLPDFIDNFNYSNFTLGATANYQIIPSMSLASLVTWRGVSLGSGILYNHSITSISVSGEDIREPIEGSTNIVFRNPKTTLNLSTNTFTIPLEAITAIKLLIFNIPFGLGADLAFGKTSLGADAKVDVDIEGLSSPINKDKPGKIALKGELSNSPSIINFKIMTGFGFIVGPVVFDIPLTFYPIGGYNLGFTIGAVF
jgi:hypothetical protein